MGRAEQERCSGRWLCWPQRRSWLSQSRMPLKAASAVRKAPALAPKMAMDPSHVADLASNAQTLISAAVDNVPFVDEVTGEAQGFTAPKNHFASVIGLWVLFA